MEKIKLFFRGLWGAIKSWTMQFNAWVGGFLLFVPDIQRDWPSVAQYIPDDIYKIGSFVLFVGNVALRIKTNKALSQR